MGNWLLSHILEVPPPRTKLQHLQDGEEEVIPGQGGALGGKEASWGTGVFGGIDQPGDKVNLHIDYQ